MTIKSRTPCGAKGGCFKRSTSTTTTATTTKKPNKQLRFRYIEIIELPMVLGDNPCVQDGPPISVCWKPQRRVKACLERFESIRPPRRGTQRMCRRLRCALLSKQGVADNEIEQATMEAKITKLQRYLSLASCESNNNNDIDQEEEQQLHQQPIEQQELELSILPSFTYAPELLTTATLQPTNLCLTTTPSPQGV